MLHFSCPALLIHFFMLVFKWCFSAGNLFSPPTILHRTYFHIVFRLFLHFLLLYTTASSFFYGINLKCFIRNSITPCNFFFSIDEAVIRICYSKTYNIVSLNPLRLKPTTLKPFVHVWVVFLPRTQFNKHTYTR